MLLRVTRAALRDLRVDPTNWSGKPAKDVAHLHPILQAFVDRRSQSPTAQEATFIRGFPPLYNLHSGKARGLTWHEKSEDLNVVWLLGVAWHVTGNSSDAYDELIARCSKGDLFPSEDDYLDLEPDPAEFVVEAAKQLPVLLSMSRMNAEREVSATIADVLVVTVLTRRISVADTELDETWVSVRMPPEPGNIVLPNDLITVVLAMLFPNATADEIQFMTSFPDRDVSSNEIIYSHCAFPGE